MKNVILFLSLLLLAVGCSSKDRELKEVSRVLETDPESALNMLDGIDREALSARGRAEFDLLTASSFYRTYFFLDGPSEAALDRACLYFDEKGPAVERLRALYRKMPRSEAVALNLGNALLQSGRASEAAGLLRKFADARKDDHLALDLLAKAYDKSGNRCQALHSRARLLSLEGAYAQAQNLLRQALNTCSSKYDRETARARVAQLSEQRRFDETISKGGLR